MGNVLKVELTGLLVGSAVRTGRAESGEEGEGAVRSASRVTCWSQWTSEITLCQLEGDRKKDRLRLSDVFQLRCLLHLQGGMLVAVLSKQYKMINFGAELDSLRE